jgi:opacity protein-like surface antigen
MKKSLLLSGLLVVGSSAMADIYVGVDYGINSNTTKVSGAANASISNKYSDLSIKVGSGKDGDWKGQLRLSRISYEKPIFDNTHETLIEFGGDIIREFTLDSVKNLYPYVKVGLGVGSMSVDGYSDSSISEVSFKAGVGVSYKAIEHLYIIGGVDYVARRWQDIQIGSSTYSIKDTGAQPYIGINYAF